MVGRAGDRFGGASGGGVDDAAATAAGDDGGAQLTEAVKGFKLLLQRERPVSVHRPDAMSMIRRRRMLREHLCVTSEVRSLRARCSGGERALLAGNPEALRGSREACRRAQVSFLKSRDGRRCMEYPVVAALV